MLNVGLISTWHVHTNDYARQLNESGKARIVSLWDENPEKGRKAAAQWNIDFDEDYDKFISRKDFSAVICDAPTTMHPALLSKAAAAGKDIFTEKVLAISASEAAALADEIRKAGVIFTISFPLLCDPKILYIKDLIDTGALGRITGARFRRSHNGVSDNWLPDYWYDTSMTGGGAMMDLGAHPVYVLGFLFGAPKRISGMTSRPFGTSSDENALAVAEFKDGILAAIETAFITCGTPDILEVYGAGGSVFMHGDEIKISSKSLQGLSFISARPEKLPAAKPAPILQFVDACVNRTGSPDFLGLDEAVLLSRVSEAVYKSDKSGNTIYF
ncbi:MAG: Gfo/Idh/MocA family oxidoreductase [Treponema sp.]|nr:Gfo/Idh/MocA family oxidoreductase [Treponema sp.]